MTSFQESRLQERSRQSRPKSARARPPASAPVHLNKRLARTDVAPCPHIAQSRRRANSKDDLSAQPRLDSTQATRSGSARPGETTHPRVLTAISVSAPFCLSVAPFGRGSRTSKICMRNHFQEILDPGKSRQPRPKAPPHGSPRDANTLLSFALRKVARSTAHTRTA